jgi:hypothetical protein
MDKIGAYTATADASDEFTEGNPSTGTPATEVDGGWLNAVQRELIEVIEQGGLTPDSGDDTQVHQAIEALIVAAFSSQSLTTNGYQELPGGLILQWGFSQATTGGSGVTFPIAFPTAIWNVTSGINSTSESSIKATSLSLTGFTFTSASVTTSHSWIAIGN